jgi:general L-amino acid transport system permease protein
MLPPQAAPISERGAVKWLRENLFSGPFNTALTILGLLAIYWLLQELMPWLLNSVWNASSLGECRQIVLARQGLSMSAEGIVTNAAGEIVDAASGACWAVIKERWHQYFFGFYPQDQYWRPVLAFGLLFVALAPVLYHGSRGASSILVGAVAALLLVSMIGLGETAGSIAIVMAIFAVLLALAWTAPSKLIWLTLLYPGVTYYLLWGGSVWAPAVVYAGLALVAAAAIAVGQSSGRILATIAAIAVFVVFFLDPISSVLNIAGGLYNLVAEFVGFNPILPGIGVSVRELLPLQPQISGALAGQLPLALDPIDSDQFGGFLLAITIGVTAISFSLPLGILLALGRQSDMFIVKTLSVGFIEFIRGVPLITLLFTASLLLQYFLPPQTNFDIILRVIILVTFFAAAYLAEVIRGGLAALPRGQYEAADALGLDYWRAQRLIVLPQALKISIPGIVSTFIGLFKDTTLVSFVGLLDPLRGVTAAVRADINWKGIYWEPYIFVGAIFFAICFGMSRYSMYLEHKLRTDRR